MFGLRFQRRFTQRRSSGSFDDGAPASQESLRHASSRVRALVKDRARHTNSPKEPFVASLPHQHAHRSSASLPSQELHFRQPFFSKTNSINNTSAIHTWPRFIVHRGVKHDIMKQIRDEKITLLIHQSVSEAPPKKYWLNWECVS